MILDLRVLRHRHGSGALGLVQEFMKWRWLAGTCLVRCIAYGMPLIVFSLWHCMVDESSFQQRDMD